MTATSITSTWWALRIPDFYPDGRDLGENYTYTPWRSSPCVKSGQLDCVHCHTSSGRYRFKDAAQANDACLPCHEERVARRARAHAPQGGQRRQRVHLLPHADDGVCPHAPQRPLDASAHAGDHAAVQFSQRLQSLPYQQERRLGGQVRAANGGHAITRNPCSNAPRSSPRPASRIGRSCRTCWRISPAPTVRRCRAVSLVRLLANCPAEEQWPVLRSLMADPSPLVRASAAEALGQRLDEPNIAALCKAAGDDYRLVRVRAATRAGGRAGGQACPRTNAPGCAARSPS